MGFNQWVSRQFAHPSGLGGNLISLVMNRQNRPLYLAALGVLAAQPGDHVLDVGCGNGEVIRILGRTHQGQITGIDPSDSALNSARAKNRRAAAAGNLTFLTGTAASIPLADASVDRAYTINTVYFWDDLDASFAELFRVLRPDGWFSNVLYSRQVLDRYAHTAHGYRKYDSAQLTASATAAGFAVSIQPLLQGEALCLHCVKPYDTTTTPTP